MKYTTWNGYKIFKDGRIFSIEQNKFIPQRRTRKGYVLCWIKLNNKWTTISVHRLMATVWLGDRPNGWEVDHINNIRWDNRLENLQWLTKAENNQKAWDSGNKNNSGINNGRCKNNPCDAHVVCLLLEEGCSPAQIRDMTGLDYNTFIRPIKRRVNWTHISNNYMF